MCDIDIMDLVASGGYGEVFRCIANGVSCAVKRVPLARTLIAACMVEPAILATMRHPHILHSTDTFIRDNCLYMTMPLARFDLHNYLLRSPPMVDANRDVLMRWMGQLASALVFLHDYNIIHGDIKPANILVYKKHVRLADFTLSVQKPTVTTAYTSTAYTITYRAPEVLMAVLSHRERRPARYWGTPADMWALGCTYFEMAYGFPAFYPQFVGKETTHNLYKTLMYIASRLAEPDTIYAFQSRLSFEFEPSTPWPDDVTGDPELDRIVFGLVSMNRYTAHQLAQLFDQPWHRPLVVSHTLDVPLEDGLPAGVGRLVQRLAYKCSDLAIDDKIRVLHVIALRVSGFPKHELVLAHDKIHSGRLERLVLAHLNFNLLHI